MPLTSDDRDFAERLASALIEKWEVNPKWNGSNTTTKLAISSGLLTEALGQLTELANSKRLDLDSLKNLRVSDRVLKAEEAIIRFQTDHGLELHDGMLGLKTWRKLVTTLTCRIADDNRKLSLTPGSDADKAHQKAQESQESNVVYDRIFYYIDWDSFPSAYREKIDGVKTIKMINHAWWLWQQHANFARSHVEHPDDANVIINMRDFDGPGGKLGEAHIGGRRNMGFKLECSLDAIEPWKATKFQACVCHEFGHILGLRDTDEPGTLMFGSYDGSVLVPQRGDIDKIVAEWGRNEDVVSDPIPERLTGPLL